MSGTQQIYRQDNPRIMPKSSVFYFENGRFMMSWSGEVYTGHYGGYPSQTGGLVDMTSYLEKLIAEAVAKAFKASAE
jgi:hypothetical protein